MKVCHQHNNGILLECRPASLQVTSAASLRLFPAGAVVRPSTAGKSSSLVFILRGAVQLQSNTNQQQQTAQAQHTRTQPKEPQLSSPDGKANHEKSVSSHLPNAMAAPLESKLTAETIGVQQDASTAEHESGLPADVQSHKGSLDDTLLQQEPWEVVDKVGGQPQLADNPDGQAALPDDGLSNVSSLNGRSSRIADNSSNLSPAVVSNHQKDVLDTVSKQSGRQGKSFQQLPGSHKVAVTGSHQQASAWDVLQAQGCAFGLPYVMQVAALDVTVTAQTVVEAFEVPWVLLKVICLSVAWPWHPY